MMNSVRNDRNNSLKNDYSTTVKVKQDSESHLSRQYQQTSVFIKQRDHRPADMEIKETRGQKNQT